MYYLGVDGGGSVTSCCVINENKEEVLHIKGGSINYRFGGMEKARANMRAMLEEIREKLGGEPDGAFIGNSALSGEASPEELAAFTKGIFSCPVRMNSDIYIALKACGLDNACVVIAGTGSMAAGFDENGGVVTRGGFGALLGDEGSGYRIAEAALRYAVLSSQDALPLSSLEDAMYDFFNVCDNEQLIGKFCSGELSRGDIAAFAEEVCRCAESGDEAANAILEEQTRLLAGTVNALLAELPGNAHLFVSGGMFKNEIYAFYFKKHLRLETLYAPVYSPEYAAAMCGERAK